MSIVGKEGISYRKKDLALSVSKIKATKGIRFAHKATAGQTVIDLENLVAPTTEMPTFVQASAAEINAMRLYVNRKNLKLKSSAGGELIQDLDFIVTDAKTITLIGAYTGDGALDGEIFEGWLPGTAVSDLVVSEGKNIRGTVTVLSGNTTLNLGNNFKVNDNPSSQIGEVKIYNAITGQILLRNTNNATAAPSADGNYQEVDSGNGYGSTIELNNAVGSDTTFVYDIGFHVHSGDVNIYSDLERLAGAVNALAVDAAVGFGTDVTDYLTATPSEVERLTFGAQVQDHETRIGELEDKPLAQAIQGTISVPSTNNPFVVAGTVYQENATLSGGVLTVLKAGYYRVKGQIQVSHTGSSGQYFNVGVFKNGTSFSYRTNRAVSGTNSMTLEVDLILPLDVGNTCFVGSLGHNITGISTSADPSIISFTWERPL